MQYRNNISPYIFLLTILFAVNLSAQHYVVSGYIVNAESNETLIGATVMHEMNGKGVISDAYGFFQFPGLNKGSNSFIVSHIGYKTTMLEISIEDKSVLLSETRLKPSVLTMDEVSVVAASSDVAGDRQVETSMLQMNSKMIQSIPAAGNDIFSAIKFLPGIGGTEPFSPLFTVRGGDPGENAVMLDGVMIYNPYHSSIVTGVFNTQTIKSVDLLVGGFGAEYGGRNSSVLYIHTKDGNSTGGVHGEIEPSTFQSKAFLEFPVGKRGSAMVAGRYYYDIFSQFLMHNTSYFYDLNLSYTLRLNPKNRFTFKYFLSQDNSGMNFNTFYEYFGNTFDFDFYDDFDLELRNRWSNQAATVIHKWILNPRMFLRTQLYYSAHNSDNLSSTNFKFDAPIEHEEGNPAANDTLFFNLQSSSNFTNHITDLAGKTNLTIRIARQNTFRIGLEYNKYYFENKASINNIDQGHLKRSPQQWALFAEDKMQFGTIIFRPGIRATQYDNYDWTFEPRLNAVVLLPAGISLKAAWGKYNQFVISMNTNEVEMNQSVDYYLPLSKYSPSQSTHYIAGISKSIKNKSQLSLEVYYKDMESVYTFDINQTANTVLTLSDKLQQGSGEAYGAELMFQGTIKNLSGWLSYGLSWANRKYPFLNGGEDYPYDYNRRHAIKLVLNYKITKNLEYNSAFTLLSGTYRSIEQVTQNYFYYDPQTEEMSFFPIWISNAKNIAKMPAIMNWNMSIRKRLRVGFGKNVSEVFNATESYLTVTIRNITFFRRNVDYYFPISGIERWEGKYLPFGTNYIPSVGFSYTIKF